MLALASMMLVVAPAMAWSQSTPAASAAATERSRNSWRVPCPFDSSMALLPVTCGRLTVPESPGTPGRVVEIAFMRIKAPSSDARRLSPPPVALLDRPAAL